jgi:predicted Zn-ribbon and HTH transcriptional regulator
VIAPLPTLRSAPLVATMSAPGPSPEPTPPPITVVPPLDADLACGTCGYNLRGLPAGGACPECGASTAGPEIELDDEGRLDADVPCRCCGYNLRGLPPPGRCPECRTAIERSLRGDYLRYCEPAWVDRLSGGMAWIVAAVLTLIGGRILSQVGMTAIIVAMSQSQSSALSNPTTLLGVYLAVTVVIMFTHAVLLARGIWLFTDRDPGEPPKEQSVDMRLIARYAVLVQLVAAPLMAYLGMVQGRIQLQAGMLGGGGLASFAGWLTILFYAVVVVGIVAAFAHARRIARRIPSRSITRQTTIVMWGVIVTKGLEAVMMVAMLVVLPAINAAMAGGQAPAVGGLAMLGTFQCASGIGKAVFGIWTIVLLFLFRIALTRTARAAREGWASAGDGC